MSLLQSIFGRFSETLSIHADSGEIVFRRGTEEARDQPLIRFAEDGRIIELGARAQSAGGGGGRLVRLFTEEGGDEDAIRSFCRYHLALISGATFLRPRVIIDERSFRMSFGPTAAASLQAALRDDGFKTELTEAT